MIKNKNIVLLHGWGAGVKKLEPLSNALEKLGWETFVPRLPGFDAPVPDKAWNVDDYAGYILKKSKAKFKSKEYFVFGHSFGGRIAIKLGSKDHKNIRGVILCATGGLSRSSSIKRGIFFVLAKFGKIFLFSMPLAKSWQKFLYKLAREHDYEKSEGAMKETFKNVISEDLKPLISRIINPTLVLWGNKDQMTPIADAHFIKRNLLNSKLVLFEDVGHRLPYEKPKQLAKEINRWAESLK